MNAFSRFKPVCLLAATAVLTSAPALAAHHVHYDYDSLYRWCEDSLGELREAEDDATEMLSRGRFGDARDRLMNGLREAQIAGETGEPQGPLTARAISRGLRVAEAVFAAVAGEANATRTDTHFLFAYYKFVRQVADELDRPLYLPYSYHCHECEQVGDDEYDRSIVEFAKDEVAAILDSLAEDDGRIVTPVGNEKAYFKAMELMAAYGAKDLSRSLHDRKFACAIKELNRLSDKMRDHDAVYSSPMSGMTRSYHEAREILERIQPEGSCFEERGW